MAECHYLRIVGAGEFNSPTILKGRPLLFYGMRKIKRLPHYSIIQGGGPYHSIG